MKAPGPGRRGRPWALAAALVAALAPLAFVHAAPLDAERAPIVFYDENLSDIFCNGFAEAWSEKGAAMTVETASGEAQAVASCAELAALAERSPLAPAPKERAAYLDRFGLCFDLSALSRAVKPKASHFDPRRLGRDLMRDLDLGTLELETSAARPAGSYRIASLKPKAKRVTAEGIVFVDGPWTNSVHLAASADFAGSGLEEFLVVLRQEKRAKGPTLDTSYILSRNAPDGAIRARRPSLAPAPARAPPCP